MPSHYPSQRPTQVQKPPHLSYTSHLCDVYPLLYPTPITCPNRSNTHGFGNNSLPAANNSLPAANSHPLLFPTRTPHIPPCPLNALRCFSKASLVSKNRSTQFCIHGSSFLSKLLDEIPPVTHFFQHVSVSSCTARKEKIGSLTLPYLGRATADILAEA